MAELPSRYVKRLLVVKTIDWFMPVKFMVTGNLENTQQNVSITEIVIMLELGSCILSSNKHSPAGK
ncbi:hypothetical protein TorRG33x02_264650 [Trema orientale]|uniref:Uncharacterized protein n=1 Tax=Trema orientale TaxID=63057 RepID=A0A2P5D2B2_TREOI|nr:hypothetical protein TorRG33x02_264650 [Trema orientale]